jgi:hypothetical protein
MKKSHIQVSFRFKYLKKIYTRIVVVHMTDMDISEFKMYVDGNEPTISDYSKSLEVIDKFFDEFIIPNIYKWNFCIYAERKGTGIFRDQQIRKENLKMLHVISSTELAEKKEFINNKSILIFDDSIKDGDTITEILDEIQFLSPEKITVAVIVGSKEVLERLRRSYPKITFVASIEVPHKDVIENHNRNIGLYLEDICLPIQEDHPVLIIRFSDGNMDDVFGRFRQYGEIIDDGCDFLSYIDRAKRTLILNKESLENILGPMREKGFVDKSPKFEEIIIIRLYLLKGKIGRLILQPIILRDFPQEKFNVKQIWDRVEMHVVHGFLIIGLTHLAEPSYMA